MKNLWAATCLVALAVTACVSTTKNTERGLASFSAADQNSTYFGGMADARPLTSAEIASLASSSKLDFTGGEARVIIDNDAAFDSKLAMIKRANKSIRMVYYIYGEDDSSSLITKALIEKAQAGVKVKLLVDFITNYARLDHFQMMVNEGKGNLKIHFYNFPAPPIFEDAKYMTLPCPEGDANKTDPKLCENAKKPMMDALAGQMTTPFSKMLLAGMYGRGLTAMKVAAGYGAGIDAKKEKAELKNLTADDQAVIFDFFKQIKRAKQGHIDAKFKVSAALSSNGATLNPLLDTLFGRLPVGDRNGVGHLNHSEVWDHLSDYTHHKLVAVDGTEFQLGGRNIEDSYHMKSRLGTKGKYIFMDTDFYGRTVPGGTREIEASFDKLASFDDTGASSFDQMIADISKVQELLPIDIVQNPEALINATGLCLQQAQKGQVPMTALGPCIEDAIVKMPMYQSRAARTNVAKKELEASYLRYTTQYQGTAKKVVSQNWRNKAYAPGVDSLAASDLAKAEIYYLENVNFDRRATGVLQRQNGSRSGGEAKFNKNIHAAWYRGMENACYVSAKTGVEKRIILHSAYLFMPSGLLHVLGRMMNGDFKDCSKVRVTFLTNSIYTTDLNVINVLARYQMSALFKYNYALEYQAKNNPSIKASFPKLDYYEYSPTSSGTGISLHTKLSVLGDDMIVGSANADVRSYYMDTNNAVLIRNAPDLIQNYTAFVDNILNDPTKSHRDGEFYAWVNDEQMRNGVAGREDLNRLYPSNSLIMKGMLARWDKKNKITPEKEKELLDHVANIGLDVFNDTTTLLRFREEWGKAQPNDEAQSEVESRLNRIANQFDDLFKTL